jgi:chromosome segregation ATPase
MSARDACNVLTDGSRHYNGELVLKAGFKKGAILRVGMMNFLTYDECDVFPGPKLNIILGPNGTGKSTITHAICLACGGKPETLGRSTDLKQFVKHDKEGQESFVEVDILTNDMSNPPKITCVRRYINSTKSARLYTVDFKPSNTNTVKQIMREVNVDVDNLCCFMAQDKVGKFTTISARGIMEQTLQNILSEESSTNSDEGGPLTLYQVQQELNDIETSKVSKGAEVRAKEAALNQCEQNIRGLEPEVEAMRKQDYNRLLLSKYQLHHTVVECGELRGSVGQKQVAVDEAEAQLQRAQEVIAPLEVQERDLRHQLEKQEKNKSSSIERLRKADEIVQNNKKKVSATDVQLGVSSEQLRNLDVERASRQRHLESTEREAETVRTNWERAKHAVKECEAGLQDIRTQTVRLEREKEVAEDLVHEKNSALDDLRREEQHLRSRLSSVRDPRQIYLAQMMKNPQFWGDEIKAMKHVISNPEEFQMEVLGPIGCYLRCQDQDVAAIVNFELRNDINAFIVQTVEDEKTLRRIAPKAKIYTVKKVDVEPFRSGYSQSDTESFQAFGFQGFLRSFIECHPLVMTWLCKVQRGLLFTLYAKTPDKRNFTDQHANSLCPGGSGPKNFRLVLRAGRPQESGPHSAADFILYTAGFSRYNSTQGRTSTTKRLELYDSRKTQFVASGDVAGGASDERTELEEALSGIADRRAGIEKAIKGSERTIKDIQQALNGHIQKSRLFKDGLRAPEQLEKQLNKLLDTIDKLQSELKKDTQSQRNKLTAAYHSQLAEILSYAEVIVQRSEDCVKLHADAAVDDDARETLETAIDDVRNALADAKEGLDAFKQRKAHAISVRDEAQKLLTAATKRLNDLATEHGGTEAFKVYYHSIRTELPEKTLPDIDARIAQLEHTISTAVDNPQLLVRYEEHLENQIALQEALTKLRKEYDQHEARVVARSSAWLEQVDHIVEKLHNKFQQYMAKLQYKGAVSIKKKGTIAEYEMQLSVSYHSDGGLAELDGTRHSGGERAVATIMYLMALQELSRAPFRCVDEINQGMDERNERLVFDQIVQSSTIDTVSASRSHQYFLISPKLLQGLRSMDHPDVTVLMVWNGAGVDKHRWQLSDVLAKVVAKRGFTDVSNTPREENSDEDVQKIDKRRRVRG